jgi:hypothetical protein
MVAAGEGEFAGRSDLGEVSRVDILGSVAALDRQTRLGREILGGHR